MARIRSDCRCYQEGHACGSWGQEGDGIAGVPRSTEVLTVYLSPLAAAQWKASMDWADSRGRVEVALHAVGVPRERRVVRLECGPQWVTTASCHNAPMGILEIGQAALAENLSIMGQVHHHPFYAASRHNSETEAAFFLSHTDWMLLEQLALELTPSTLVSTREFSPRATVVARATAETRLEADGRRYGLGFDPGTVLTLGGLEWEETRGHAEAFVAVTGSDRALPHGYALRGEVCGRCGVLGRRRIHPVEFTVAETDAPRCSRESFDEDAWRALLHQRVRRGYGYARQGQGLRAVTPETMDQSGTLADECAPDGPPDLPGDRVREEVEERLEVLERLVAGESPEAAIITELRTMLDRWFAGT